MCNQQVCELDDDLKWFHNPTSDNATAPFRGYAALADRDRLAHLLRREPALSHDQLPLYLCDERATAPQPAQPQPQEVADGHSGRSVGRSDVHTRLATVSQLIFAKNASMYLAAAAPKSIW